MLSNATCVATMRYDEWRGDEEWRDMSSSSKGGPSAKAAAAFSHRVALMSRRAENMRWVGPGQYCLPRCPTNFEPTDTLVS
jgi:hypothetical protein